MSLKGGGGGSSSESTTTSIDKRLVVDSGIGISSDTSTLNLQVLDGGSVAAALDFAAQNDLTTGENIAALLGLTGNIFAGALTVLDRNADLVQSSGNLVATAYEDAKGQTADNKYLIAGALAIVGLVAVKSFKR